MRIWSLCQLSRFPEATTVHDMMFYFSIGAPAGNLKRPNPKWGRKSQKILQYQDYGWNRKGHSLS